MSTLKVDNLLLSNNNAGTGRILEVVSGVCDGRSITTMSGTYSLENVTAQQTLNSTFTDVNGSSISYNPPEGTKRVVYEFIHSMAWSDAHAISHWKTFIDGVEVTKARHTISGYYPERQERHSWIFHIGGSDDSTVGQVSTWTSSKTLKLQAREYGTSNGYDKLFATTYWDGSGNNQFSVPILTITAIG